MATRNAAKDLETLANMVGIGNSADPFCESPDVVEITIWDGRRVIASRWPDWKEGEPVDIENRNADVIFDVDALEPLIERLINGGATFTTLTQGFDKDSFEPLRWRIESARN